MPSEKLFANASSEEPFITPEGIRRRLLSYGGSMLAVQFEFDAGMHLPIHSHAHEQIGYVILGELDLIMEGQETRRLSAGCSYYVPPHVRHGAVIHTQALVLDCFTPVREDYLVQVDVSRQDLP